MKIIKNQHGYTTSILILLLIIPLLLLTIITIEEYDNEVDVTVEKIESNEIKSTTEDFENEIIKTTKETLHTVSLQVITTNKPLTNSNRIIKDKIQENINNLQKQYSKNNIKIDCTIKDIKASNDPFYLELQYSLEIKNNNSDIKISKEEKKYIEITDENYPVYDTLPTLQTGATFTNNNCFYSDKLSNYLSTNNSQVYKNSVQRVIIRKCPYDNYLQHGDSVQTIKNCLNNHYYHNSHDGVCFLCRLENKTYCNHYGLETFIIPTGKTDKAPVSIDHVLLNTHNNQYSGNNITIDNNTVIYLDNGHKAKYGL